ncbi:MAG TPA: serine/threonine-protein kinase [Caldilineaceae bacterium]|nr:serine/threonine-protein kinase [Caldilineaceae bacterium]
MAGTFHSVGEVDEQRTAGGAAPHAPIGRLEGQQIGRYLVQRRLGGGGVATVYQAYDQVMGRTVALKVLPPNPDGATLGRFRREALMAGALRHPHIVRIYQVGASERGGAAYIAMELVEGESLSDLLARYGQLRPEESCNLLEPVARALAFAHQHGIVHRDVKPGNILLRPVSPGAPHSIQLEALDHPVMPLLSDFGVARFLDAPELTSTGRTVGTPAFMAPEQCLGSREVDGRTDIYALGVVLYRCIVGRLPFTGSTTQVLHAQVYDPVVIEDGLLRQLSPLVIRLLQRSLAKAPEDRYADAGQMAADLAEAAQRMPPASRRQVSEATAATATLTLTSAVVPPPPSASSPVTVLVAGSGTSAPASAPAPSAPPPYPRVRRWTQWGGMAAAVLLAALAGLLAGRAFYQAEQAGSVTPTARGQLAVLAPPAASPVSTAAATPIVAGGGTVTAEAVTPQEAAIAPAASPAGQGAPSEAGPSGPGQAGSGQLEPAEDAAPVAPASTPAAPPSPTATPIPPSPTPAAMQPTEDVGDTLPATPAPPTVAPKAGEPLTESELVGGVCATVVDEFFVALMATIDAALREEFSCPTAPAYGAVGYYLAFEQGFMLRLDENPLIYVYYQPTGEWEQVVSTAAAPPAGEGAPAVEEGAPPGLFGQVWAEGQRHIALGRPLAPEPATLDALVQVFTGGILVGNRADNSVFIFPRSKLRL